jgi:ATP-dependent protease ClpP protease subunit
MAGKAIPRRVRNESRRWYQFTNKADDKAEVMIYDEIGMWGVSASDFAAELNAVKAPQIELRLNSPGGEVFDGIAIYNALRNHPAEITVRVEGLAASIASVIAMAGDRIVAEKTAQMMIHDGHAVCVGNAKDMLGAASLLDKCSDNIASIYADRAGGDVASWRARMQAETWFSAEEAKSVGLVDEVVASGGKPRNTWDLTIFNYAGRDKAPDPTVAPEPPETPPDPEHETNPADEPGFLMPDIDPAVVRDSITAAMGVPFDLDLFRAAIALGVNNVPSPEPPKADPVPEPEPELSIDLPAFRRAIREARL